MTTTPVRQLCSPSATSGRVCRECAATFTLPDFIPAAIAALVRVCPECSEKRAAADSRRAVLESKRMRAERWKAICPPEFIGTDPRKLPCPSQYKAVMAWEYGPRGLIFHGATGRGKSRCAWTLLRREWEAGRTVAALDSSAGVTYAAKYSESGADVQRWIDRLCRVDVALLDDIFKCRLTDSFEAAIFTIVNQRTENRVPLVVTCNDTGSTLLERLTPDRGAAMLRRLREFCDSISFA